MLTSTNQKSLKLVESITKKKSSKIDLILLGELKPTGEYLSEKVVLVTSEPRQVASFLKENGFDSTALNTFYRRNSIELQSMSSSGFRQTMLNVMRESEDSSSQGIIRRSHPSKEKMVHHWLVDKDSTGKFATTEISNERQSVETSRIRKRRSEEADESEVKEYDEHQMREAGKA